MQFFTAADANQDFDDPSGVKKDPQGDDCEAFFIRSNSQLLQLGGVHSHLSRPLGVVVPNSCLFVFGNIRSDQPQLSLVHPHIGFVQR